MIQVRLFNDAEIVVNSDLIEFVESTPDTVISLSTGKKLMVKDSVADVVEKIIEFRRRLGPAAGATPRVRPRRAAAEGSA